MYSPSFALSTPGGRSVHDAAIPSPFQPRRKGSTEEMAEGSEIARLRAALDNAYKGMYDDDPALPSSFSSLRKRLANLLSETNLSPDHVVDRGVSFAPAWARFTVHADFMARLEDVVSSTQAVMDLLYAALQDDVENPVKGWQFDPDGALFKGLTEARSIVSLHMAWGMMHNRAAAALGVHRKYRERVEAKLEGRQPTILSPLSTPRSVYGEMRNFDDNELRLKFLLGAVPSMRATARSAKDKDLPPALPSKEDRSRFINANLPEVVQVPSPLARAFPDREPERSPQLLYYENGKRKERAPTTTYGNPDPLPPFAPVEHPKGLKTPYGHRVPPPNEDDPSVPGPSRSTSRGRARFSSPDNWRERPPPDTGASVSAFGVFSSTGTPRPPGEDFLSLGRWRSASSASNSRDPYPYAGPHDERVLRNAANSISSRAPTPHSSRKDKGLPPPPTPNWFPYYSTSQVGSGNGKGGGGAGPPFPPSDPSVHASATPRVPPPGGGGAPPPPPPRQGAGGGGGGPPGGGGTGPPYIDPSGGNPDASGPLGGRNAPGIQTNLKMDVIPSWNGDRRTVVDYVWPFFELANGGGNLRQSVAQWAWLRFEKGSPISTWYLTLSENTKRYMKSDAYAFIDVIKQEYLGPQWMKDMAVDFQLQSFREPKHRHETPSSFINRRILDARSLGFAVENSLEEVKLVLSVAPADWDTKLIPSTILTTDELKARVIQHERSLSMSTASVNQDIRSQVTSILREWGRLTPDQRRRMPASRAPVAYDVEADNLEDGAAEEGEQAPVDIEPANSDTADELFAVAYSVAASKEKSNPPRSYAFPPRDSVVSRKPPPSPCRACGSRKHWNRDCPHWQQFLLKQQKEGYLVDSDPEGDRAYNAAYSAMMQGFEGAAPLLSAQDESEERKAQVKSEDPRPSFSVHHQSFAVTVEEIGEEYWYRGEMLPADYPHILEHVDDVAEEPHARLGAREERKSARTNEAFMMEPEPEPPDKLPDAQAEIPAPKPYEPPKVRLIARKRVRSLDGKGTAVLCVLGFLGSEGEVRLLLRIDSCASLSLLSGATYDAMKNPPPLKQGAKMRLWQLTDKSVKIRGYVHMPVLMRTNDGTLLEAEAELYVVDGMTVPVLLGEDFQQKYELSVNRSVEDGTTLTFGQLPLPISATGTQRTSDYDEVERAYIGEKPVHGWLKKAHRQHLKVARRERKRRAASCDNTVRALRKTLLRPETVVNVPVSGPFDEEEEWVVEKELLTSGEQRPFAIPNTLLSSSRPVLPVANLASTPRYIQEGEVLATVSRAKDTFDKPSDQEDLLRHRQHAALLSEMSRIAQQAGQPGLGGGDGRERDKARRPSFERNSPPRCFHMPESVNYDAWKAGRRSFPMPDAESYAAWNESFQQEREGMEDEPAREPCGPKTAELPDAEDVSSKDFRKVLDVGRLPEHLQERAWAMLEKRKGAFALDGKLGNHPAMAQIRVKDDARPIAVPMYGTSPAKKEFMDEQISKWFEQEVIEDSRSPWSAPVVIAYRNGKPRFCVDYRRLNAMTIPDEFPIPRQQEILASLSGAQVLSSLDALSGFTQLRLDPRDVEKTAFRTHRGLFQFKRMPFGLRNGPSIFQRVMQSVLAPYLWLFSLVYIDDIVVYSKSFEDHIDHLDKVLGAIEDANITLSPKKCHLFYDSIILLGHEVSRLGLSTHYEKVRAVLEMKRPTCVSELQTFLGMLVYFNAFIPYYADVCGPLHALLKKNSPWRWGEDEEYAFLQAKTALQRAPVLGHPIEGQPYRLYTDASGHALGSALQQVQPIKVGDLKGTRAYEKIKEAYDARKPVPVLVSRISSKVDDVPVPGPWGATFDDTVVHAERVVAYWSRTFRGAEVRYSTTEREALAAKEALVKFQPYLEGAQTLLVTDHSALQWARTYEKSNRRLASWGTIFSSYEPGLEIIHRAGRTHSNVDPLSRIPRDPPSCLTPRAPESEALRTDSATAALREAVADRSAAPRAFVGFSWADCALDAPVAFAVRRSSRLAKRGAELVNAQRTPEELAQTQDSQDTQQQRANHKQPREEEEQANNQLAESDEEDERDLLEAPLNPLYAPAFARPPALLSYLSNDMKAKFKTAYLAEAYWKRRYLEADTVEAGWTPGRRYYKSEDGLLFFLDADYLPRLCVPDRLIGEIMLSAHEEPMEGGHTGMAKLWARLHPKFYWKRMKATLKEFCGSCDACQKNKHATFKKYGTLIPNPIPQAPYESISMDFIMDLPTSSGFNAIFVVVDRLTKHAHFVPTVTTIDRKKTARLFVQEIVAKHGLPASIVSDKDPRWTSDFWKDVASEMQSKLLMSSAHHAQMDGQTEVVNRFLETMLRAYAATDPSSWANYLFMMEFVYNSSVHRSTGESPFMLLMGYQPRSMLDRANENSAGTGGASRLVETKEFFEDLRIRREAARDAIATAQDEQAKTYNKGRKRPPVFKQGDLVLVNPHSMEWVESKGKAKLTQRWIGPFEIVQKINPCVYRLKMDDTYPGVPVFNLDHLKPYHQGKSDVEDKRIRLPPTRTGKIPSEEYHVEKIVDHKWLRKGTQLKLKVRWVGYGWEHDTWQSERDLRNAPERVAEYKLRHGL